MNVYKPIIIFLTVTLSLMAGAQSRSNLSYERALELRKVEIHSTVVPSFIYEDGHQYPCFATREAAINYFHQLTILHDLEVIYIATDEPVIKGENDKEILVFTYND